MPNELSREEARQLKWIAQNAGDVKASVSEVIPGVEGPEVASTIDTLRESLNETNIDLSELRENVGRRISELDNRHTGRLNDLKKRVESAHASINDIMDDVGNLRSRISLLETDQSNLWDELSETSIRGKIEGMNISRLRNDAGFLTRVDWSDIDRPEAVDWLDDVDHLGFRDFLDDMDIDGRFDSSFIGDLTDLRNKLNIPDFPLDWSVTKDSLDVTASELMAQKGSFGALKDAWKTGAKSSIGADYSKYGLREIFETLRQIFDGLHSEYLNLDDDIGEMKRLWNDHHGGADWADGFWIAFKHTFLDSTPHDMKPSKWPWTETYSFKGGRGFFHRTGILSHRGKELMARARDIVDDKVDVSYSDIRGEIQTISDKVSAIGAGGGQGVPSKPTGVVVNGGVESADISWTEVGGADEYVIFHAPGPSSPYSELAVVSVLSYNHTNITSNVPGDHYYYVVASNSAGDSAPSEEEVAYIESGTPPGAPTNVNAQTLSSDSIKVSWTEPSEKPDSYDIFRRRLGGSWSKVKNIVVTSPLPSNYSWDDTGLNPDTTYEYKVRGVSQAGNGDFSSVVNATTNPSGGGPVPSAPTGLGGMSDPYGNLEVFWDKNPAGENVDKYKVTGCGDVVTVWSGDCSGGQCSTTGISCQQTDTPHDEVIEVRAHNSAGWSSPAQVTVTIPGGYGGT